MIQRKLQIAIGIVLVILALSGCGGPSVALPTSTSVPPTNTSIPPTITPVPPTPTATPRPSFDVLLTDRSGAQTKVTSLKVHVHDSCKGFIYYVSVPTETDFDWEFIRFFTGEYEVDIPFEIIQKVEVKVGDFLDDKRDSIMLADGTVIQGKEIMEAWGDIDTMLTGETDLGTLQIAFEDISEMTPLYEPKSTYIASADGTERAILSLQDGTELKLENAAFYRQARNENGCYVGNQIYETSMMFETTGGSIYDLTWEKIDSISFRDDLSYTDEFDLITPSGSTYSGKAKNIVGFEGTVAFGSYTLTVRVRFHTVAKSLIFGR